MICIWLFLCFSISISRKEEKCRQVYFHIKKFFIWIFNISVSRKIFFLLSFHYFIHYFSAKLGKKGLEYLNILFYEESFFFSWFFSFIYLIWKLSLKFEVCGSLWGKFFIWKFLSFFLVMSILEKFLLKMHRVFLLDENYKDRDGLQLSSLQYLPLNSSDQPL